MSDPNKLLSDVGSKYGAPMGRQESSDPDADIKVRLFRVRMVDGDYDEGGAYWGGGPFVPPLFCAIGEDFQVFRRASSRDDAKAQLREEFPSLRFYR